MFVVVDILTLIGPIVNDCPSPTVNGRDRNAVLFSDAKVGGVAEVPLIAPSILVVAVNAPDEKTTVALTSQSPAVKEIEVTSTDVFVVNVIGLPTNTELVIYS